MTQHMSRHFYKPAGELQSKYKAEFLEENKYILQKLQVIKMSGTMMRININVQHKE